MITGNTNLSYRGFDGYTRSINPDNYATVAQYNELKTSVSSGKAQIASAITDKGVSTAASAAFSQMASNIRNINTMPSLLGTWKFNDTLFFPSQAFNSTRENSVIYTFTNNQGTVLTGTAFQMGMDPTTGRYVIQCYGGGWYYIYNTYNNIGWYNEQSKYITFTSITPSAQYDVEKYVLSIILPYATKIS